MEGELLDCEECGKEFLVDEHSYGCNECDIHVCYRCVAHLPQSETRSQHISKLLTPGQETRRHRSEFHSDGWPIRDTGSDGWKVGRWRPERD